MKQTIAVIGAGNMGGCLIGGLIANGHPCDKLWAADTNPDKLDELQKKFQIHTTIDNEEAIENADVIVFAIKPNLFVDIASALSATIQARKPLVLSVVTGIHESHIQQWLGGNIAIVRAMPNTPALIGCGAAALYANSFVNEDQHSTAESILRAVGIAVWLDEERLLDIVTGLSGSGPAYFFLMMEALQAAAEELGLSENIARLLTLQTALGAARMAIENGKPLDELRRNVTSPGGTTEKALSVLEEYNIRTIFKNAVEAAKKKAEELGS